MAEEEAQHEPTMEEILSSIRRIISEDGEPVDEDEPLFKLDRHTLVQGEYVSITEHDGVLRTFRVVGVR